MKSLININCTVVDEIEYCTKTDKHTYHLGENVSMLHRVTNLGNESAVFWFGSSPYYQFEVIIWEDIIWSRPKQTIDVIGNLILEPNDFRMYTKIWDMIDEGEGYTPNDDTIVTPDIYEIKGALRGYIPVSVSVKIVP